MASYGTTTLRPAPTSPPLSISPADEFKLSTRKYLFNFIIFTFPFNISSNPNPESAADRIIRNLGKFSSHYAIFIWAALFITLIWNHKLSFLYLIAITQVTFLYFVLLHTIHDLFVLHKATGKRFDWFLAFKLLLLFVVIIAVELILAQGELFLFAALAAAMPITGLHAALRRGEDECVNAEEGDQCENLV